MSSTPIAVRGLRKTFHDEGRGEVRAVDGVDFECRAGEIFGLLGANGAGKTTTLRMLATILAPTAGQASVMGHDVAAEPEEARRSLGFYSASTALYPRLTAREILQLFLDLHRAGNTLVLVTHEPTIAAQCPRAIRMSDGRIVADGPGPQVAAELGLGAAAAS